MVYSQRLVLNVCTKYVKLQIMDIHSPIIQFIYSLIDGDLWLRVNFIPKKNFEMVHIFFSVLYCNADICSRI